MLIYLYSASSQLFSSCYTFLFMLLFKLIYFLPLSACSSWSFSISLIISSSTQFFLCSSIYIYSNNKLSPVAQQKVSWLDNAGVCICLLFSLLFAFQMNFWYIMSEHVDLWAVLVHWQKVSGPTIFHNLILSFHHYK